MFMPDKTTGPRRSASGTGAIPRSLSSSSASSRSSSGGAGGGRANTEWDVTSAAASTETLAYCLQENDIQGFADALGQCLGALRKLELRGRNAHSLHQRMKDTIASATTQVLSADPVMTALISQLDEISLKPVPSARVPTMHPSLTAKLIMGNWNSDLSRSSRLRSILSYLIDATGRRAWIDDTECSSCANQIFQKILDAPGDKDWCENVEEALIVVLQTRELAISASNYKEALDTLITNTSLRHLIDLSVLRKLPKGNLKNIIHIASQTCQFDSVRFFSSHRLPTWAQSASIEHQVQPLLSKLLKREVESSNANVSIVRALFHAALVSKVNKESALRMLLNVAFKSVNWLLVIGTFALENDVRLLPLVLQACKTHAHTLRSKLQKTTQIVCTKSINDKYVLSERVLDTLHNSNDADVTMDDLSTTNESECHSTIVSYAFGLIWARYLRMWCLSRFLDTPGWENVFAQAINGDGLSRSQLMDNISTQPYTEGLQQNRAYLQGLFQSSLCYISNYSILIGMNRNERLNAEIIGLSMSLGDFLLEQYNEDLFNLFSTEALARFSLQRNWLIPLTVYNDIRLHQLHTNTVGQVLKFFSAVECYVDTKSSLLQHGLVHSLRGLYFVEDLQRRAQNFECNPEALVKQFDSLANALKQPKLSLIVHCFDRKGPVDTWEDSESFLKGFAENRIKFIEKGCVSDSLSIKGSRKDALRFLAEVADVCINTGFLFSRACFVGERNKNDLVKQIQSYRDDSIEAIIKINFWKCTHQLGLMFPGVACGHSSCSDNPLLHAFYEISQLGESIPCISVTSVNAFLWNCFYGGQRCEADKTVLKKSLDNFLHYICQAVNTIDYIHTREGEEVEVVEWARCARDSIHNLSGSSENNGMTGVILTWLCDYWNEDTLFWDDCSSSIDFRPVDKDCVSRYGGQEIIEICSKPLALLWCNPLVKTLSRQLWQDSGRLEEFQFAHTQQLILAAAGAVIFNSLGCDRNDPKSVWQQICYCVQDHYRHFAKREDIWEKVFEAGSQIEITLENLTMSPLRFTAPLRKLEDPPVFGEFLESVAQLLLHDSKQVKKPPAWLQRVLVYDTSLSEKLPPFTLAFLALSSATSLCASQNTKQIVEETRHLASCASQKLCQLSKEDFQTHSERIMQISFEFLESYDIYPLVTKAPGQIHWGPVVKAAVVNSVLNMIFSPVFGDHRVMCTLRWSAWIINRNKVDKLFDCSCYLIKQMTVHLVTALHLDTRIAALQLRAVVDSFRILYQTKFSLERMVFDVFAAGIMFSLQTGEQDDGLLDSLFQLFKFCRRQTSDVLQELDSLIENQNFTSVDRSVLSTVYQRWLQVSAVHDAEVNYQDWKYLQDHCSAFGIATHQPVTENNVQNIETLNKETNINDPRFELRTRQSSTSSDIYSEIRRPLHWCIHSECLFRQFLPGDYTAQLTLIDCLEQENDFALPAEHNRTACRDSERLHNACQYICQILKHDEAKALSTSDKIQTLEAIFKRLLLSMNALRDNANMWVSHLGKVVMEDAMISSSQLEHTLLYILRMICSESMTFLSKQKIISVLEAVVSKHDPRKGVGEKLLQSTDWLLSRHSRCNYAMLSTVNERPIGIHVFDLLSQMTDRIGHCIVYRMMLAASLNKLEDPIALRTAVAMTSFRLQQLVDFRENGKCFAIDSSLFCTSQSGLMPPFVSTIQQPQYEVEFASFEDSPRKKLQFLKTSGRLSSIIEIMLVYRFADTQTLSMHPNVVSEIFCNLWNIMELLAGSRVLVGYIGFIDLFSRLMCKCLGETEFSSKIAQLSYGRSKILSKVANKYNFIPSLLVLCDTVENQVLKDWESIANVTCSSPGLMEFDRKLWECTSVARSKRSQRCLGSSNHRLSTCALLARRVLFYSESSAEIEQDNARNGSVQSTVTTTEKKIESNNTEFGKDYGKQMHSRSGDEEPKKRFADIANSAAEGCPVTETSTAVGSSIMTFNSASNSLCHSQHEKETRVTSEVTTENATEQPPPTTDGSSSKKVLTMSTPGNCSLTASTNEGTVASDTSAVGLYSLLMNSTALLYDIQLPHSLWAHFQSDFASLRPDKASDYLDSIIQPVETQLPLDSVAFENDVALQMVIDTSYDMTEGESMEKSPMAEQTLISPQKKRKIRDKHADTVDDTNKEILSKLPEEIGGNEDIERVLALLIQYTTKVAMFSKLGEQSQEIQEIELLEPSAGDLWSSVLNPVFPAILELSKLSDTLSAYCRRRLLEIIQLIVMSTPWRTEKGSSEQFLLSSAYTAATNVFEADSQVCRHSDLQSSELQEWRQLIYGLERCHHIVDVDHDNSGTTIGNGDDD